MPEVTGNNIRYKSFVSNSPRIQCHFFCTLPTVEIFSISLFPSHSGATGFLLFQQIAIAYVVVHFLRILETGL